MAVVTYRGPQADLQGTSWTVPESVLSAGQGVAWIESQHRQQLAEEAAKQEAEERQQSLLAARLEQQRLAAEADAATPAPSRDELKAELQQELGALSTSVIAAAAAITGRGEAEAAARADWEGRHEQLVSTSEATITEAQAQVQAAMATSQSAAEQVQAELQEHRLEVRNLETELRETVAGLIGPEGPVGPMGLAGASTVIATEDPLEVDAKSFASRWLGRPLIDGDGALVLRPDEILVRRYLRGAWSAGPSITPKQELVSARISALDASTKVTTLMSGGGGSGGGLGGGGGESLLSRTVATGGTAMLSESARWAIPLAAAGLPAPDACTVTLELTAADGGNAGRKLFITGKALYEGLATPPGSFTVYSELGELVGKVDVEFSIQVVPAVLPPGLPAVTLPPGVLSAQVFARITSNTSGATQFLLAGAVSWMQPNAVTPAGSTTPPQITPAWTLI